MANYTYENLPVYAIGEKLRIDPRMLDKKVWSSNCISSDFAMFPAKISQTGYTHENNFAKLTYVVKEARQGSVKVAIWENGRALETIPWWVNTPVFLPALTDWVEEFTIVEKGVA